MQAFKKYQQLKNQYFFQQTTYLCDVYVIPNIQKWWHTGRDLVWVVTGYNYCNQVLLWTYANEI